MSKVVDIRTRRAPLTKVGISMSIEAGRVSFTHGDSVEIWDMPADHAIRFARRLMASARGAQRIDDVEKRRGQFRLVRKGKRT